MIRQMVAIQVTMITLQTDLQWMESPQTLQPKQKVI